MKTQQLPKILFGLILMLLIIGLSPEVAEAQCRMCAAGAEANLKNGGSEGAGLNAGILYLLSMPYLLFGTIAGAWYWHYRKAKKTEEQELIRDLLS